MLDAQLIAASLQSRAAFEDVAPHISKDDLTAPGGFWFDIIRDWYKRDGDARSVDKTLLVTLGKKKITNPKHEQALLGFMNDLPEAPSPGNVANVVLELKRHNVGMELASAIAGNDTKKVGKLLSQFTELQQATTLKAKAQWEDAVHWTKLDDVAGDKNRIPLAPKLLNERTDGGALPGDHIIVYGRPEVGKSTWTINMTRGFLYSGQRALYIGNEDNINKLKKRMRNRLTMWSTAQVKANPEEANKLAEQREREHGGELNMRHLHRGSIDDLRRAIDEFEPTVLILDQIRNLQTSGDDKMTQKLEAVAIEVRNLLSTYHLVGVSVTQANDRTERHGQEPPLWLGMSDIDSSRTGLPAQADLLIGIGANSEMLSRSQRAISLPKNKMSDEDNSHEGFIVEYDLKRSSVK
jgi:KaiC/GvpD/RAD55 family RecA-like ATPase